VVVVSVCPDDGVPLIAGTAVATGTPAACAAPGTTNGDRAQQSSSQRVGFISTSCV
jgi:membrane-bound ClpP family serine protease